MKLHNYQISAYRHIVEHPYSGIFMEMGLGKTISTLLAIRYLMYEEFEINKVLIIAPKRVAENVWTDEIDKWGLDLKVSKIMGTSIERKIAMKTKADIYLLGRDNVQWFVDQKDHSFDMAVLDESSSFKNPRSKRFKALRGLHFDRVVLLTGTPSPNSLMDLWAQIYLLDRGERLERFITRFRDNYFVPGKRNGAIIYSYDIRKGAEKQIHNKISDICISMKTKDYLDLPESINNDINVYFPDELKKKYKEFKSDMILEIIGDHEITALNAAVLANKLLQFSNGAIYDEERNVHEIHDLKLKACEELIEEGKPVLIAWSFKHDRDRLMKHFKKMNPRELKDRKDIEDWNKGEIQILMMHPASGGHGLNLQAGGNRIIWFGQTWSLELYQQFNARLDRQGQKEPVIINRIIVKGTIDDKVISVRNNKSNKQSALMKAIKKEIL